MVQLISLGSQDAFLTGTPKQTFFVSVFMRNTPFLLNTVKIPFNGTSRFGERTICKIPQTGDIITGLSLLSTLPRLGTPSNVYTYVGPIKNSFQIKVNGTVYTVPLPDVASTNNLNWLRVLPGLSFGQDLTITSTNDSTSVGPVLGPVNNVVTYNSTTDTGIQFTTSDPVPGFNTLVTNDPLAPGILFEGYSGQFPAAGFTSRDSKYLMYAPKLDTNLQPDVPAGQVYGRHWTFTFPTQKAFTLATIVVPQSTSPLSLAQVPGWVYVFGSNDNGTTWTLISTPTQGSSVVLSGTYWYSYRILVASAGTSGFLASCFILSKPGQTIIDTMTQDVTDLMCLESNVITVNGTYTTDIPLSQSPVWTYTNEKNITYKSETGNLLIKNAILRLGGQTINQVPGEYTSLIQDLEVPDENQIGLTALVGKNDTQRVIADKTYLANIPFFERLPSCSLSYHDIEVEIEVEDFRNLLPYKGLGPFDISSQTVISNSYPTQNTPLIVTSNTYFTSGSNLILFDSETFSNVASGKSGKPVKICSQIYTFDGTVLTGPSGNINVPGSTIGTDTLSTLYIFNQGSSNIFTSYDASLTFSNSFVKNSRFSLPPGYITATVDYLDLNQALYRTVNVPFIIREQATTSTSNIVQIYSDTGVYYANAIVPWVTRLAWNSDYNANCYFSSDATYQYQLGTLVTSNVSSNASSEAPFRWKTQGKFFPSEFSGPTSYFYSTSIGSANVYYTGEFIESMNYEQDTDPYGTVPPDPSLVASFVYSLGVDGTWKTITSSNLNTYNVYRGIQTVKKTRVANVLVGYQSMVYDVSVPSGSNLVVTYYKYDGYMVTTNVTTTGTIIDSPSTYENTDGTIEQLSGTTKCDYDGSRIIITGPLPIYSVVLNNVELTHRPVPGFVQPRTFPLTTSFVIDGSPVSLTPNTNVWVTDRLYAVAGASNVTFYGPGKINGSNETFGSITNLKAEMNRGLVILSDSTPWQSRINADRVYYIGTYWALPTRLWPINLSVTFYDATNKGTTVSAPKETFGRILRSSGYASASGPDESNPIWTLKNAYFATCYDIRTRYFLGLGSNQVIPITYYSDPKVKLTAGTLPNYSYVTGISDVSIEPSTDSQYRVYSGSITSNHLIQVTGNAMAVYDYTGQLTPNRSLEPTHESYFMTLSDGSNVYWVSRNGNVIAYDTTLEFGSDGSMTHFANSVSSNVWHSTITNKHIVLSDGTLPVLTFIDKVSGQVTPLTIDRTAGILSWDGARYLSVFGNESVLQIDTIVYSTPDQISLNMLVETALLSESERNHFIMAQNDHLFKQIQVEEVVIKPDTDEVQFETQFKNLVSELFFTIDDDGLDAVALSFNGYPVLDYDDAGSELALSKIQPFEHHSRIPDRPFWMYSFAKWPEDMNPSGFVNMSRIRDQVISVRLIPSAQERTLKIWATSYNITRFRDGLCGLLY